MFEKFEAAGINAFQYGFVGKDLLTKVVKVGEEEVEEDGEIIMSPVYEEQLALNDDGSQKERWNLRHSELSICDSMGRNSKR